MAQKVVRTQQEHMDTRHTFGGNAPSGLRHSWRLWRFCCCRYGWYPLVVAPIVTVGCLFSVYSAFGCDFIRVDVGFTPSNTGWNSSTLELGLFLYQSGEEDTNKYRAAFVDGCRAYTEDFVDEFVTDDRTWRVAQIMAYVSAGGSIMATISTWLFVVSPLPARFFWPVVVLPSLVASFLAEASKFLFYDTSLCRKNVWFPPGTESLPRTANCSLGATAVYGIASGIIFLICLILVCLKAPNRRDLEPNYGLDVENGNIETANPQSLYRKQSQMKRISSFDSDSGRDPNVHTSRPMDGSGYSIGEDDGESGVTSMYSRGYESGYDSYVTSKNGSQRDLRYDEDELVSQQRSKSADQTGDGENIDKHNPAQPPATDVTIIRNRSSGGDSFSVSRSRLETVERMEKNASNMNQSSEQMIDHFLNDLEESFQLECAPEENDDR